MINQDSSKNFTSTNDATCASNHAASNHLLVAYERKNVELKVIKNMISMYQDSFSEKEKILEEEKQKLNELSYQIWSLKDTFCNQVWRFSCEYDFSSMFRYYPCEDGHCTKQEDIHKDVDPYLERSQTLIDLINEIDFIKTEVHSLNNEKDLKRNMENALMNLKRLQIISEDTVELLRLISSLGPSYTLTMTMPICNAVISDHSDKIRPYKNNSGLRNMRISQSKLSLRNKSWLKSDMSNDVSNRKEVTSISKKYPELPLESAIFSTNAVITNVSTEPTKNQRSENFNLKRRSQISIRFEQDREHK